MNGNVDHYYVRSLEYFYDLYNKLYVSIFKIGVFFFYCVVCFVTLIYTRVVERTYSNSICLPWARSKSVTACSYRPAWVAWRVTQGRRPSPIVTRTPSVWARRRTPAPSVGRPSGSARPACRGPPNNVRSENQGPGGWVRKTGNAEKRFYAYSFIRVKCFSWINQTPAPAEVKRLLLRSSYLNNRQVVFLASAHMFSKFEASLWIYSQRFPDIVFFCNNTFSKMSKSS